MARTVRMADEVVFRELASGSGVLLHLVSGQYYEVSRTGADICRLVDGARDETALADALTDQYPGGTDVHADVTEFVDEMLARSLFVEVS